MNLGFVEYRWGFVALIVMTVFAFAYAVASAPSRVASRLGMRGYKRQKALADNPAWAQLEPLIRWLGVRMSGLLGDRFRARLDRQLALAGDYLGITAEEYVGLSIFSFIGGIGFGVIAGYLSDMGNMLVLIVAPVAAALPYVAVQSEIDRRMKEVNRNLPYAIDLMSLAMTAGQDFPGAVRQVVEKSSDPDDACVEELGRILQELQLGRTRRQALEGLARRVPLESVQEFVGAIIQAEERGNPVVDVLRIQANVSRVRRTVKAEEAASKAGVAMVAPLFLLFFCIMLLVMGPMLLKLSAQAE